MKYFILSTEARLLSVAFLRVQRVQLLRAYIFVRVRVCSVSG